jgi:hypothetical protein
MALTGCLIALVLAAPPQGTEGLPDIQVLQMAERAFSQGVLARERPDQARPLFRTAGDCYTALHQRGVQNADLDRNQGNAYLLAGDLPRAILAYRRGLRLAPADRLLQANLAYARAQVIFPEAGTLGRPPEEQRPPWLPWIAPGWRLAFGLGFYSLACLALVRWRMVQAGRWLAVAAAAALATMLLAFSLAADEHLRRQEALYPLAIIAKDGVQLRKGNGLAYPPRYQSAVNRGAEARVLFQRGDWFQVELAGGEVGWVPAGSILLDGPS